VRIRELEKQEIETIVDVEAAIDKLSDDLRLPLLWYYTGYTQREIGEALEITKQSVNERIQKAIEFLHNLLYVA